MERQQIKWLLFVGLIFFVASGFHIGFYYFWLAERFVVLYFGGIVVLQRGFVLLTGQQSTLGVVALTLLIAALFTPLRRRIQSFIGPASTVGNTTQGRLWKSSPRS